MNPSFCALRRVVGNKLLNRKPILDRATCAEVKTFPLSASWRPRLTAGKDLDLITTTTGNQIKNGASFQNGLAPEWETVDISSLNEIRFSRNQVKQVADQGLLIADQLQESIYAFAFDLEVNGKGREINGAALNYFMGILRKGPYAPPANYESPEIRQMRLYLEAKERERRTREPNLFLHQTLQNPGVRGITFN